MENNMISFAGVRHPDIPYYLAKLLAGDGRQILLIDNSELHDLFSSLHMDEEDRTYGETAIGNIHCLKDIAYSKKAFDKFDYVIVYHGFDIDDTIWNESNGRYLMVNTDRYLLKIVRDRMIGEKSRSLSLLILDAYFEKLDEEDIAELLTLNTDDIRGVFTLPFDPVDMSTLQSFQFNGMQNVNKLSSAMKMLLHEIYNDLFGETNKRAFKRVLEMAD